MNQIIPSRRTFLRTASATLALPLLESVCGAADDLQKQSAIGLDGTPPTRFVTLYFPNGCHPSGWKTSQHGGQLRLDGVTTPLAPLSKHMITFSGINHPLGSHLGQTSGFLSGVNLFANERGSLQSGTSLDQMIAAKIGGESFLPSLHLGVEPPSQGAFGDRPRSFGNSISWSSPTTKIEPMILPRLAFDHVFYGQTAAGRKAAERDQRLVDRVWDQAKSLRSKVSVGDTRKLDQYFDSMQQLETQLVKATGSSTRQSSGVPTKPKSDDSGYDGSAAAIYEKHRPVEAGMPAKHDDHIRLMLDILLMALWTDSTRVGTFVMGHSISRIVFNFVNSAITSHHHDLSHHGNNPKKIEQYNTVVRWLTSQVAYFAGRMNEMQEDNGTLLDNSVVLYGSGMSDGDFHDETNIPVVLLGGAGGRLKTGRKIECGEGTVLASLHLSLANLFGLPMDNFNEVTKTTVTL